MRAKTSCIALNETDAAIVKGMLLRGDRQHDVAAWFGVNGGRIAEVAAGKLFGWVHPTFDDLPPPGPYMLGRRATEAAKGLEIAQDALRKAEKALREAHLI